MKKLLLVCIAPTLILAGSCRKSEPNVVQDQYTLLTTGRWKMIADHTYMLAATRTDTVDNYAARMPCENDNLYTFRTDQHILNDEGATKCDSSLPQQTDLYLWNLPYDNTLYINDGRLSTAYTIDWLDEGTLVIRFEGYDPLAGSNNIHVVAYTHRQ